MNALKLFALKSRVPYSDCSMSCCHHSVHYHSFATALFESRREVLKCSTREPKRVIEVVPKREQSSQNGKRKTKTKLETMTPIISIAGGGLYRGQRMPYENNKCN